MDLNILAENILNEIKNTHNTITIKEILNYLQNGNDTETHLKIKWSNNFKNYLKENNKIFYGNCEKCNKKSFFFKFEEKKFEITEDNKAFLIKRNKRLNQIYFNPEADNTLDIFGEENSRLAEALIESKNLDLRDFLFKGDGRGTLNLKI